MPPARLLLLLFHAVFLGLAGLLATGHAAPPSWVLALLLLLYLGLLGLGALWPALELYGDQLLAVETRRPLLALSFDDGPDPSSTPRVLEVLAEHGMRATFFVLGERAAQHPELTRRIVAEGHELGLHSWSHDRMLAFRGTARLVEELRRCQAVLEQLTGRRALWFRPPVGQTSPRVFAACRHLGLELVAWSAKARDGYYKTTEAQALARLVSAAKPGAILLLHDAWERPEGKPAPEPAGVRLLPQLLKELRARGLRSVTVSELLGSVELD